MSKFDRRRTIAEARPFEGKVLSDFREMGLKADVMGSYRRHWHGDTEVAVVGDLDVLIVMEPGEPDLLGVPARPNLMTTALPWYLVPTPAKASGWLMFDDDDRMMIDGWMCTPDEAGPFGFFLTGPPELNVVMRQISQRAGLMLTQYGLFEPMRKPTKTYPKRVVPGVRVDEPGGWLDIGVAETVFWNQWVELVGLPEWAPCPAARDREEVTRWLQGRLRDMRLAETTPG